MKELYCPICGNNITYKNNYCNFCKITHEEPIIPKRTIYEYMAEAKIRFPESAVSFEGRSGERRWEEIVLIDEISRNPMFDKNACFSRLRNNEKEYRKRLITNKSDSELYKKRIIHKQKNNLDTQTKFIAFSTCGTKICPKCESRWWKSNYKTNYVTIFGVVVSKSYAYTCSNCGCKFNTQIFNIDKTYGYLYEYN